MKKKKWKIRNLAVSQERAVHFKPFIFSFGIKSMLPIFSLNSFFFFFCLVTCRILVPSPGIEPGSLQWEHGLSGKSPCYPYVNHRFLKSLLNGLMQSHGGQDENSGHEITLENFEKLSTLETLWREKLNFRHFSYNY